MTNILEDFIETSGIAEGERLPPERELAEKLSLPRSALRKMLADLEANGKLTRQVGRGTFVGYGTGNAPIRTERAEIRTFPAEVFETRLIVEPAIAALAAQRISSQELDELERVFQRGAPPIRLSEFEHWDSTFHKAVVAACRNALLIALYDQIDVVRAGKLWGRLKENSLNDARMAVYHGHHKEILAALADRDSEEAGQAMRRHILAARTGILGS